MTRPANEGVSEFPIVTERAARSIHSMSVSVAQLLEMHKGVDLRWDPDEKAWHCAKVTPIVWFDQALLSTSTRPDYGPWFVDGDKITLTALNGSWIWIKTGRQRDADLATSPEAPGLQLEARWPD